MPRPILTVRGRGKSLYPQAHFVIQRILKRLKEHNMLTATMIEVAAQLAEEGIAYFTTLKQNAANGTITEEDLNNAAAKLDADIDALVAARNAQKQRQAEADATTANIGTGASKAGPAGTTTT